MFQTPLSYKPLLSTKSTNLTSFRIPFFAMMKKRPRRKMPVAKFNTSYSFSCTSELTNRAAEAASAAAGFLPVTLAHDWDLVENADEQLETWKSKRTPTSARAKKSSASPWKLKVKVRAMEPELASRSRASPKKDKKAKQEKPKKKKKRRSSMADSSSEGKSPKKSVPEKPLTVSVKEEPSPKKKASSSTSGEETPKRVIIPEKLFALGAKKPSAAAGEEGGKQKPYDIAAIKRTLLEQQKSGPPPKKLAAEKTPNPTRPFGRLPGSLLDESAGGSVRPLKRRYAYEPKMKFVKASPSSSGTGGMDAGLPSTGSAGAGAGGAPGKPSSDISSTPEKSVGIPMEETARARAAAVFTSSESEAENAERRPASPKPLLSTFSPSKEKDKSVDSAVGRRRYPDNFQPITKPPSCSGILALGGNNTTCSRVIDNVSSQTTASGGTINQEGEVEIATEMERVELSLLQSSTPPRASPGHPVRMGEKEKEMKAPSDKEDVLSQQSTEVDTDVQTDVESATAEQPPAPRDKVGAGPEGKNKAKGGELGKKTSQSTSNLADEEEEKSLLEDLYIKFTSQHAMKNSILEKRIAEYRENNFTREINLNVLKVQLGRLWKTCSPSVFGNIVMQLTKPDYASCHRKLFCDVLFQVIKTEKPNPEKDYEFCDRGLPALTNKQIKVLALLDALSKTEVMADVCSSFANYLYYALFGVGRIYHMPQFSSINLVRFYIVLMRQGGLEDKCRLFLFDMLFFKNSRNHIFVRVLIEVWPEILTWPHYANLPHPGNVIDPIVETVVWMINNTGPANCLRDLMVFEARNLLVRCCNVKFPKVDGKDLVRKLLLQVRNSPRDEVFKASTTMGLMLLGKWMDWRWTNNNISFQLLDMLGKCFKAGDTQLLPWVIETLGFVSRVYPVDGREHLSSLFEQIKVVITSDMITEPLERICCLALIRVGHHLQFQVAGFLAKWRPKFPLDPGVEKIMWNFVGTRAKIFSQKTINIHKKGKIYGQIAAPAKRAST